jgi:hypothetical protein
LQACSWYRKVQADIFRQLNGIFKVLTALHENQTCSYTVTLWERPGIFRGYEELKFYPHITEDLQIHQLSGLLVIIDLVYLCNFFVIRV